MEITLRQASKLRSKVETAAAEARIGCINNIHVNVQDENYLEQINDASNKVVDALNRNGKLEGALLALRILIGEANASSGINARLATNARLNAKLGVLKSLTKATPRLTDEQITARVKGALARLDTASYASEDLNMSIHSQSQIDEFKTMEKEIRKMIESVTDDLESLNNTINITLPEEVITILTDEDLI